MKVKCIRPDSYSGFFHISCRSMETTTQSGQASQGYKRACSLFNSLSEVAF
nr:MAG TPA: hypothetical protein [Caudoviricetes sp.]